jgi:ribosome maturation protein SDO1
MISLDKAVVAKYSSGDKNFEILVEPEAAWRIRKGESLDLENVIAARDIYTDSKKGERASDGDLNKVFGTNDFARIVVKIIRDGELQLTTDQKRRMQEQRRKQLIDLIARSAVDPRTHIPHPPLRIERALDEARIHVDPFKSAEEQMDAAIKALRPIIPIKMETVRIAVKIPAEHAPRSYGAMREYKLIKEEWASNGALILLIEIPAGMQGTFLDRLNKLTSGDNETKITERI